MASKKKSKKDERTDAVQIDETTVTAEDISEEVAPDIAAETATSNGPDSENDYVPEAQDADPLPEAPSDEQVALEDEIVEAQDIPEDDNVADDDAVPEPELSEESNVDSDAGEADPLPEAPSEEQVALEEEIVEPRDVPEDEIDEDGLASAEDADVTEDPVVANEAEEPVSDHIQADLEPEPEPVRSTSPSAPVAEPQSSPGVGTLLLGGLLAGAIGYLLASANLLPAPWKAADPALAELRSEVEAQGTLIEGLGSAAAPVDLSPLETQIAEIGERIDGIGGRLSEVGESVAALTTRMESLEARPVGEGSAAPAVEVDLSAYEAQLAQLEETVKSQRAEVEAMIADAKALDDQAADAQLRASIQAGVARLQAAAEQGTPFQDVLTDLKAVGADVPEALEAAAGDGVATLSTLRSGFPDAARDALAQVRSGSDSAGSLGAFLQRQLGARSVEPREGDDADAVLSRVEANLTSGDLAASLSEVDALPDAARSALSDWIALARQRLAVQQAIGELAASATEN